MKMRLARHRLVRVSLTLPYLADRTKSTSTILKLPGRPLAQFFDKISSANLASRCYQQGRGHIRAEMPFVLVRTARYASSKTRSLDMACDPKLGETPSIEGAIEGESCSSSSPSLAISLARSGGIGRGSPSAIRKRSPISAQMARECSSSI
jgi:hypothetical protein